MVERLYQAGAKRDTSSSKEKVRKGGNFYLSYFFPLEILVLLSTAHECRLLRDLCLDLNSLEKGWEKTAP